jgi:hypothetical protein
MRINIAQIRSLHAHRYRADPISSTKTIVGSRTAAQRISPMQPTQKTRITRMILLIDAHSDMFPSLAVTHHHRHQLHLEAISRIQQHHFESRGERGWTDGVERLGTLTGLVISDIGSPMRSAVKMTQR